MRIIKKLLEKEGWHLAEAGLPIQVGVRTGTSPFGKSHLHKTMPEYFLLLEGEVRLQVMGEILEIKKGDLVLVEPGEAHEVLQASVDALLLLLMPPPVAGDKVES
jgi:quercetin dioxygenase-like cupin family protein